MTSRAITLASLLVLMLSDVPREVFHDDFRGKLADGWSWIREMPADWRVSDKGLEVRVRPGNMWGPANDAHNLLVRAAPSDRNLEITTAVSNHPTHQYEQVDLVWYYDDGNMVKVGQELVEGKLSVVMGREENDKTKTISITPITADSLQLRLRVAENKVEGFYKTEASAWKRAGSCTPPVKGVPKITLMFYQGASDAPHWARVSDFTISVIPNR